MIIAFKILIIVGLLKILMLTEKPFLCSGIYTGIAFIINLAFGYSLLTAFIFAAISFFTASLYFWLLNRYQYGLPYWSILIAGLIIGAV